MTRLPPYVRDFALTISLIAGALLLLLWVNLQPPPEWTPRASAGKDSLTPPSQQQDGKHFTPESLAVRPVAEIAPSIPAAAGSMRWRVGVGLPDQDPAYFNWPVPRPGWYLNWNVNLVWEPIFWGLWKRPVVALPAPSLGMEFMPMVRMQAGKLSPDSHTLRELAAGRPGLTWAIGNEPDVIWQDNTAPEIYAIAYHRAYTAIKAGDPTARVAIGGVSQITPLRLAYLDRVWNFYLEHYGEPMPVDVWNIHTFVLREDRRDWGVNIPPGFEIQHRGMLWEVADHDRLDLVEEQVWLMREWMAAHGQQDKPLWITEYGILMPEEYGFTANAVQEFLVGSFNLFDSLMDPALGYPADNNRLVQRWNWYSARDSRFAAGNLFDNAGEMTRLGQTLRDYLLISP
jgi:hypothetical protein